MNVVQSVCNNRIGHSVHWLRIRIPGTAVIRRDFYSRSGGDVFTVNLFAYRGCRDKHPVFYVETRDVVRPERFGFNVIIKTDEPVRRAHQSASRTEPNRIARKKDVRNEVAYRAFGILRIHDDRRMFRVLAGSFNENIFELAQREILGYCLRKQVDSRG